MLVRALPAAALTLLAAVPAGGLQVPDEGMRGRPTAVMGVVVDRDSRQPVEGAAVALVLQDSSRAAPTGHRTLTDAAGRFLLTGVDDGRYLVTLDAFGYAPMEDTVNYRSRMGLRVQVEMVPEAVELDPLLVMTEVRSSTLDTNGFYERRRRGIGRFVSREEMGAGVLPRVSDIFRSMPGVRMSSTGRFGEDGVVLLRGGCVADVYLDGIPTVSPFPVDALLGPGDLDGVEVYHGSEVPARFGTSPCGVVLFWTHSPNRSRGGDPFTWKKLLAVVGFLGITSLLLR